MGLQEFRANDGYERWRKWAEWPMVALALIFLVVLLLPLSASLTAAERQALWIANIAIWGIFVIEYGVRLYLAQERVDWFKHHIPDTVVVAVPFLRPFRLIRVASILVSSGRRAAGMVVQRVMIYVACSAAVVMAVCAVIVYHSERLAKGSNIHSIGSALWWALTTVTTVGYGDKFPITTTGRVTAAVLMFVGIGLVGCITAAVAAAFVNAVRGKPGHEAVVADVHEKHQVVMSKLDELSSAVARIHGELDHMKHNAGSNRHGGIVELEYDGDPS
jgi:voltage-gated potassium channel